MILKKDVVLNNSQIFKHYCYHKVLRPKCLITIIPKYYIPYCCNNLIIFDRSHNMVMDYVDDKFPSKLFYWYEHEIDSVHCVKCDTCVCEEYCRCCESCNRYICEHCISHYEYLRSSIFIVRTLWFSLLQM